MRRFALAALAVLIVAGAVAGAYALLDRAKAADAQPSAFSIKIGEDLMIRLQSNPTTGYSWTAKYDRGLLELVEDTFSPPSSTLMGVPGTQTFRFKGLAAGTTKVTLDYVRPWEGQPADTAEYTVTITR